ncbi:hypothetical protein [Halobellus ruber]|uniref:Uncharacterized protein n=1 Tax=Halobellus ruber TaxID=2761102 RepID=A0A7J9SKY2_9EURY|nr:hypothetical protein [Halobellus ruber]MBB6647162.1 hypothetical protein [Halobellus ruber]
MSASVILNPSTVGAALLPAGTSITELDPFADPESVTDPVATRVTVLLSVTVPSYSPSRTSIRCPSVAASTAA